MTISPTKIHDLLYFSTLYIGEGGTMASEAAVLGTPSIYVNTLKMGYIANLEQKYNLLYSIFEEDKFLEIVNDLLKQKNLKMKWRKRKEKMLSDKIDVSEWVIRNYIENY